MPASLTTATALLSAAMTGAVVCSSPSSSREVSFVTADRATVLADLYAGSGSDAVVLAHGAPSTRRARRPSPSGSPTTGGAAGLAIDFRG
jgi:hypothetical protein